MFLEPNAMGFGFPDFGGAFSRTIGPLSEWFRIALAVEHRALRDVLVGSRPVRFRDLPRLDATVPRPLSCTRGRLFGVHRLDDGLVLEALDDGERLVPTDEELARAERMLLDGTTEDPIHLALARSSHFTDERDADERKERRAELRSYVDRLASLDEASRLAHALADPDDVADAWLEREAVALATPERLVSHVAAHGVRAMRLVDRAYVKAKPAARAVWLPLVHQGLAHPDGAVVRAALSMRLDDKHVDGALLAHVPLARVVDDAELAGALVNWLTVVILRRVTKGAAPPDVGPLLDAIAPHRRARARLNDAFFDDRWAKSASRVEVLAWYARAAREGFDDDELPALVLAEPPPDLVERIVERARVATPTSLLLGAISCAWERAHAISDALEEVLVAWATIDDRWPLELGTQRSLAGARLRLRIAARSLPDDPERAAVYVAFAAKVLGLALVLVHPVDDAIALARETPMHAAIASWLERHPDAEDDVRTRAKSFLADAVSYARARGRGPELETELLASTGR